MRHVNRVDILKKCDPLVLHLRGTASLSFPYNVFIYFFKVSVVLRLNLKKRLHHSTKQQTSTQQHEHLQSDNVAC